MKFITKGIQVISSFGVGLFIPAPKDNELSKIEQSEEYTVEIKKICKKRSLNANAFCWVLCQRIAEQLTRDGQYTSRTDVYRKAIKDCGHFTPLPVRADAVERFKAIWSAHGIGWLTEDIGDARKTRGYKIIAAYHGSSVYDVDEMRRLLDCLTDEAVQLGITLEPPEYMQALLDDWGNANEEKPENVGKGQEGRIQTG